MMQRSDCFRVLAAHRAGNIVVCFSSIALEWLAVSPCDLNYTFVGAVGQAASHGLGLALAFPHRRVLILDSDSSLLTNLGCLVTLAEVAPRNLVHLLVDSRPGTGKKERLTHDQRPSFVAMASAAGYPMVREYEELTDFQVELPDLLTAEGPVFADLRVNAAPQQCAEQRETLFSEERQRTFQWATSPANTGESPHNQ